jgi:phytoene synthase
MKKNNKIKNTNFISGQNLWGFSEWKFLEEKVSSEIINSDYENKAFYIGKKMGKKILKNYSNSFFTVTRFLPKHKRDLVEIIYASVRYPDEIVDTFDLNPKDKNVLLDNWKEKFIESKKYSSIIESVKAGIPSIISCYRKAASNTNIPDEYYLSFIEAMRKDIEISEYKNMDKLIEDYVYGSAIVVGYFLAYIYGPNKNYTVSDLLTPSKDLGIALQLTNFARDVYEDYYRGRFYVPSNLSEKPKNKVELEDYVFKSRKILATEAELWYSKAEKGMDYFSADSQIAIKTCLELYRKLNKKILSKEMPIDYIYSLSMKEKLSFIPIKKFWKLSLLYF